MMKVLKEGIREKYWLVLTDDIELCKCFNEDFADYIIELLENDIDFNNKGFISQMYNKISEKEHDFRSIEK